ncbi:nucleotide kinase domain-containing protein [Cellulomonas sp. ES6]|uniref:nucleotide kinase domain-containing protein n=1 Tax=Cellulomonas sp. ES6 TaxID=3039384 RepID=UPI0024B820AD|nr:nucleotide kinase domain-containing protein [Cellulomonas sp. ES6]WHP18932.1 putative DNA base hypermodification protein [Cellulomonas sp. ES6]
MRTIRIGRRTAVATEVLRSYWFVAAERQRVYHQRLRGAPPPWTTDLILSTYRFTNAYRAADRVSQDLIQVQYRGPQAPDDLLLRTILYRFFNKPSTWRAIEDAVGTVSLEAFDVARINNSLERLMRRGQTIYSPAYIIPPPKFGARRKHLNHLLLAQHILESGATQSVLGARTMRDVFDTISSYPSLGPFLAFQLTVDLNYSTLLDFEEDQFVVAGPGARSGIAKCFADTGGASHEDIIRWAVDNQEEEFAYYGLEFQDLFGRRLALIDCQNLFCETDKYARVAHPEAVGIGRRSRIKQRFAPASAVPAPFFPPKWGINERAISAVADERMATATDLFGSVARSSEPVGAELR